MLAITGQSAAAKAAWRASLMRKIVSRRLWANSFDSFWQKMQQAGLATISHHMWWVATKKSGPEVRKLWLENWVLWSLAALLALWGEGLPGDLRR